MFDFKLSRLAVAAAAVAVGAGRFRNWHRPRTSAAAPSPGRRWIWTTMVSRTTCASRSKPRGDRIRSAVASLTSAPSLAITTDQRRTAHLRRPRHDRHGAYQLRLPTGRHRLRVDDDLLRGDEPQSRYALRGAVLQQRAHLQPAEQRRWRDWNIQTTIYLKDGNLAPKVDLPIILEVPKLQSDGMAARCHCRTGPSTSAPAIPMPTSCATVWRIRASSAVPTRRRIAATPTLPACRSIRTPVC